MLKLADWKNEKETLHRLSQILGKHKLASAFQEPQWRHVVLDITTTGFSTGLLFYQSSTYSISINLVDHFILVETQTASEKIPLKDGITIQSYYQQIQQALFRNGIEVTINERPQEVTDTTLFSKDTHHCHYNEETSRSVLQLMAFATRALQYFIAPYRARKMNPGLFWGTFDISCLIHYNAFHEMFEPTQIIEYAAFDEHFIEFGFWFGDDRFEGPTFFILPYPFVDQSFTFEQPLIEGAYFDSQLTELIYEMKSMNSETLNALSAFFNQGFEIFKSHLSWENCEHYHVPLKMNTNQIQQKPYPH
ncbi:DUF5996 family protein [Staphylococcus lutrae]|uniref:Uncharacterized protein n=1 Tax=Staphylococcus lutrae TaxID=155085 RepID=A0AAC9RUB2_9STAP|nr:DUF5996 family protein [Staphylococcus lutrae]ARJ50907.1 hypothetical protein B5P37_06025 [Staphylococcus lutrae]PNZ34163.1 hypothetical protein CD134_11140 [Staphylococcus lutrae]